MGTRDSYAAGTPSWTDLFTTDMAAAKGFYGALLGWEAMDVPTDQEGRPYTMFFLDGRPAAGGGEIGPEQQGMPPAWTMYVSVDDAAATAARAAELGGTIVMPAMDVMDQGRMAMIADPTGAVFGLWEPNQHIGAGIVNGPGAFSWSEVNTRDPETATAFYTGLFGWEASVDPSNPGYTVWMADGKFRGGMLEMNEDWGDLPPHWMNYFGVEDCDAAATKVTELGGRVMVAPFEMSVGKIAVVSDPTGAVFTLFEGTNYDD